MRIRIFLSCYALLFKPILLHIATFRLSLQPPPFIPPFDHSLTSTTCGGISPQKERTERLFVPYRPPSNLCCMVPARSSTFSMDSFSTLDGVVYQEPCRPSPIIHRQGNLHLQIPEDIELTSYPPQKDLNSPQWSDSQHSTLVGETSVSPTARFLTSPFTTSPISAKKSNLDLPNSESVQYPPKIHAKWEKVRDPVALMGLTPYGGLPHAAKSSKLVGLEGKPLHAIFDKLDPCSATCK